MKIEETELVTLLTETVEAGRAGCAELRDQDIEDILRRHKVPAGNDSRVYTVTELKKMPVGTVFHHSSNGRGVVQDKGNGKRMMMWDNGGTTDFVSNSPPWNRPMTLKFLPPLTS